MKYILVICCFVLSMYGSDFKALLFNGNCTTCHFIDKAVSAPSMKEVQKVYKDAFINKKDFVKYMSDWVEKPNKNSALMHSSIDKYGLMPELAFDKDTLHQITEYIYDMK